MGFMFCDQKTLHSSEGGGGSWEGYKFVEFVLIHLK